jgi:hypothetical protein
MKRLDDATLRAYGTKLATFVKVSAIALLAVVAMAYAVPAQSQTLTFTVEDSDTASPYVPRLTWATTPAATTCTASTQPADSSWAGTKQVNGTLVLPALTATRAYTLVCTWPGDLTARVRWQAPEVNTDGSPYTDPGGYRIQYGRDPADLDQSVYLQDPDVREWRSPELPPGSWTFGVRAYNALGIESAMALAGSKTITAAVTQTATHEVKITVPKEPTNLTVE